MQHLNDAYTRLDEGNKVYHRGNYEAALEKYNSALHSALSAADEVGMDNGAKLVICAVRNRRAAALFRLGRFQEVIDDCKQTIELGHLRRKAYIRLGGAYSSLGDHERAANAYIRALREDRQEHKDERVRQYLQQARAHAESAQSEDAKDVVQEQLPEGQEKQGGEDVQGEIYNLWAHGTRAMLNESNYDSAVGDFSRALEHSERAYSQNPKDVGVRFTQHTLLGRRSTALRKMDRFEEALKDADRMIQIAPTSERGYIRKVQVYLGMAQATLEETVGKNPESANAFRSTLNSLEMILDSLSYVNVINNRAGDR
mmetsp:Transcript_5239/g.15677  ORF Transcript_5239/g.15677 Transcript_5239/m.15677 type:complete len:314 (-) Transcript_5239:295-1236(-)